MAWLTPEELPEDDDCRPLFIPASSDWLAIVSGAILDLTKEYNWQQEGAVTVEQAVARMQLMMDQYYEAACNDCTLPDGEPIFRVSPTGAIEQLIDGTWQAPVGDYALPPITPREGGTPEDQRCLAATNAENTLHLWYEEISDAFALGVSVAEMATLIVGMVGAAVAIPLGLIAGALIAIGAIFFEEFFAFLDYLTEDVWDLEFTEAIKCFLYECSINTDGVVTFDINCLWSKLVYEADTFDLDLQQQRLLGQVGYLLSIIGADGLNLAGATTAIETGDCDGCDDSWCFTMDMAIENWDGVGYPVNSCSPTWVSGLGWRTTRGTGGCANIAGQNVITAVNFTYPSTFIKKVVINGYSLDRTGGIVYAVGFPAINRGGTPAIQGANVGNGVSLGVVLNINALSTGITAEFQNGNHSAGVSATGSAILAVVTFHGTGECPFGVPNCLPD